MFAYEIIGQSIGVMLALLTLYFAYRGMMRDRKRRKGKSYAYSGMGPRDRVTHEEDEEAEVK